MAEIKVFISFEFDKDRQLKECFVSQAHRYGLPFKVRDSSLREAVPLATWRRVASAAIKESDWVFVLIGSDTHNAHGVWDEIQMAKQHGRPMLQIRPIGKTWGLVSVDLQHHAWRWKTIRNHLDGKHHGC